MRLRKSADGRLARWSAVGLSRWQATHPPGYGGSNPTLVPSTCLCSVPIRGRSIAIG